jgi:hypothetical protein
MVLDTAQYPSVSLCSGNHERGGWTDGLQVVGFAANPQVVVC